MLLHPYSPKKYIKLSLPPALVLSVLPSAGGEKTKNLSRSSVFSLHLPPKSLAGEKLRCGLPSENRANPQEHLRLLPGRFRPDEPPGANALGDHPGQSSHPVPCPESFLFPGLPRPAVRHPGAKDTVRAGGFERTK